MVSCSVFAQPDLRIEVTGSNIFQRIESETSLPVQVITRDDIVRANLNTAAEIVYTITANINGVNEFSAVGTSQQPGLAAASLRGLGPMNTLVLLNGRRIANYAFTTIGGDLNSIPVAAIERVEILTDGASAIYGSDATAGVINFIMRKQMEGVEAYAQYTSPEHTGGYAKQFTAGAGYGDLTAQKFNAYAIVNYQQFGGVQARDRSFAAGAFFPNEGPPGFLDRTSGNAFPANVDTPNPAIPGGINIRNPSGDPTNAYRNPTCAPPLSATTPNNAFQCRWYGSGSTTVVDPSEKLNVVGSFTWQFDPDHQFFAYGTYARGEFHYSIGPPQISEQVTYQNRNRFLLPSTSPFYPHAFAQFYGIDGTPLNVRWRAVELGDRTIEPISQQWNLVGGMQGVLHGWNYTGALNYNESRVESRYTRGFYLESRLIPIVNSGVVNPFGPNTPDVIALMETAKVEPSQRNGKGSIATFDFHASSDVYRLPAGPLALALGTEARHEELTLDTSPELAAGDVLNVGAFPPVSGSRTVWAIFAEANVPIVKSLEANVAVRYDYYSDFGGTTNPKVSLRWQPDPTILLRASAGTGFFAASLLGLNVPPATVRTGVGFDDPIRCPVTRSPQDCNTILTVLDTGGRGLQPVTSNQWSVGGVWAPIPAFSVGLDYISIIQTNSIRAFGATEIFNQCADGLHGSTCQYIHRGNVDPNFPSLPGPITYVDAFLTNLGKVKTSAIDVNARLRLPATEFGQFKLTFNGTYTIEWMAQQLDGGYINFVNHNVIPYWHHYLVVDWNLGAWSLTLTENFQTGTYDQIPNPVTAPSLRRIGDYDIWNISGSYAGLKNWTLSAGVKNLLDRAPPFSNQNTYNVNGYDPSYTDPRGRLYWAGIRYAFK
jgi:iron complex outermembrane receptor protein